MIAIVPLELRMIQFRSHFNTVIDFGSPSARIFINGENGSGKTTILYAFQYLLGMEIESYDDFFHEEGDQYLNKARLELKVLNKNYERNHVFEKEFWIDLNAERNGEKIRADYQIRYIDGRTEPFSREKLKEFGNWNDPFMFVPDDALTSWVKATPNERYKKVMKLMGIENLYSQLRNVSKSKETAENSIRIHEAKCTELDKDLEFAEKEYQTFLEYQRNQEQIHSKESSLFLIQVITSIQQYISKRDSILSNLEESHSNIDLIKEYTQGIRKSQEKIDEITNQITTFESDKSKIQSDLEERRKIKYKLEELTSKIESLDELLHDVDITEKQNRLNFLSSEINRLNGEKVVLINDKSKSETELLEIKEGKLPVSKDALKFRKLLEDSKIKCDFLFNLLEIKKGEEKWSKFIESHLGTNKYGLLVQENDIEKAYDLNAQFGAFSAPILGIKSKWKRSPPSVKFRNWQDILEIKLTDFPYHEVENLLNRIMGNVYFIEDRSEREQIFDENRGALIYCMDDYTYLDYKQEKFRDPIDKCIGEKGKSDRKKYLSEHISQINNAIASLENDFTIKKPEAEQLNKLISDWKEYQAKISEMQKLQRQYGSLENNIQKIDDLAAKLDELKETMRDPKKLINEYQAKKDTLNKNLDDTIQKKDEAERRIRQLTQEINQTIQEFKEYSNQWAASVGEDITEFNFEPDIIQDSILPYPEIPENFYIHLPWSIELEDPQSVHYNLQILREHGNSLLKLFHDDIVQRREELIKQKQKFSEEIQKFNEEFDKWNKEMLQISGDISQKVETWKGSIQSNFSLMMKGQKMDGELLFNSENPLEGEYELEFKIASKIGGSTRYKMKNFSKGERTRISFGFLLAILKERDGSFFIWDEFDPNLDEDKKERLTELLCNHIPGKPIIISPQTPIKKFIDSFDRFIIISKDAKEHSIAKYYDPKKISNISTIDGIISKTSHESTEKKANN